MIAVAVCIAVVALLLAGVVKVAAHGRRLNLQRVLSGAELALDELDAIEEAVNLAVPGGPDDHRAIANARLLIARQRVEASAVARMCRHSLVAKGVQA